MPPDALPDGGGADGTAPNGDPEGGTPGNVSSGGGQAATDGGRGGVAASDRVDGGVGGGTVADEQEGKGDEVSARYFVRSLKKKYKHFSLLFFCRFFLSLTTFVVKSLSIFCCYFIFHLSHFINIFSKKHISILLYLSTFRFIVDRYLDTTTEFLVKHFMSDNQSIHQPIIQSPFEDLIASNPNALMVAHNCKNVYRCVCVRNICEMLRLVQSIENVSIRFPASAGVSTLVRNKSP